MTNSEESAEHESSDFGPLTLRQAENLADFAIRRGESRQFERLGRAVYEKLLYLAGAVGIALWYFLSDTIRAMVK